ncbi:histidinol-phosphatase HisJ family protein [Erysipelothrix sp. HDW6C]|uniref:histidinol-phosphatase HisJ family protein n=1 Tax=Erysipelothrix sp. HDW6C TaxID=2714930 RepID=UPI00140751F6|nr:histidinol-phosphatase HisJ family protein [Erysipelothrix sp. HDW6C]QIK70259.1 histidinol-phosphatase HisJ family protein [Erysipelothrix sp. HDW6C]
MTKELFVDYHVHCDYSDDSWYPMEDVVNDAIALGLDAICFTDHVDYGVKVDWHEMHKARIVDGERILNVDYPRYFAEIDRLQERYGDMISIKRGLEFGMQMHTIASFQRVFDAYPMDFVLLSVHQVNDQEFWTGDFQKGRSEHESYTRYYKEMYDLVSTYHNYSCLAHMDLIRRYLDKETDAFDAHKAMITKILEVVIADGKGIEVNTSSHRYGINGITPSIEILKLYRALGGRIITIGSDSHKKEHLGAYIQSSRAILKELGFTEYCTFSKMEPIFHKL